MNTYRNINFTKRNADCTNIVACVADTAPNANFVACDASVLVGLDRLHKQGNAVFYGFM